MKKMLKVLSVCALVVGITACSSTPKESLYLLNWGEYINPDVVSDFEKEFNVEVVLDEVDSNESMYEKIKSGNTPYDVAIPSDYMIEKLSKEGLLNNLDSSILTNYDKNNVVDYVTKSGFDLNVAMPYFGGTIGIMYSTQNQPELKDAITKNGWASLFDQKVLPEGTKVGMYDSSRDAIAAGLMYNGYSVNTTDDSQLTKAEESLKNMNYFLWGTDNLKREIISGNLDMALVYSGDYFDELSVALEEGKDINFGYYVPSTSNIFIDGMVVPTTSKNPELANQFINFMISHDNALANFDYVGYAPMFKDVNQSVKEDEAYADLVNDPFFNPDTIPNFKGELYKDLGKDYSTKTEELLSKAKKQ